MRYIHNTQEKTLEFNEEDLKKILGLNKEVSQFEEFEKTIQAKNSFGEYIEKYGLEDELKDKVVFDNKRFEFIEKSELVQTNNGDILEIDLEEVIEKFKLKTAEIRDNIMSKYLLSENLSFLIGNGCSKYAGSMTINQENSDKLKEILKGSSINDKSLKKFINKLLKERPEKVLDKLIQARNYYGLLGNKRRIFKKLNTLIKMYKEKFIEDYVLQIDYSKNYVHKDFLKRIISRESHLNKVNIFTLNYDLLIEKSAEELGIIVNNGFFGFTVRKFNPSYYSIDYHVKGFNKVKPFNKSINLYKLHGSINWKEDENAIPYGIVEQQPIFENGKLVIKSEDNIIYPIQTKIKQSLDLPYSEMFRAFVNHINSKNSTLIVIGYSFFDNHVNDIIANALSNPDFNLVVFSYSKETDRNISKFLEKLYEQSKEDKRITIFSGPILGRFEYIVKYLMPYYSSENPEEFLYNTPNKLKEGKSNV